MKIGIIGGGPSGLVFLKELLQQGHDCTCFEADSKIGGVFSKSYPNARLTSSNILTAFSDFSDGKENQPRFWNFPEYLNYLNDYADHFALFPHIKLDHKVLNLEKSEKQYSLKVENSNSLEGSSIHKFDRIAICCGTHQTPALLEKPGMDKFAGKIIHSSEFENAEDFFGKRVLIVGAGESSSDISLEVSKVASATAVSVRNHTGHIVWRNMSDVFAKSPSLGASDLSTTRSLHSLPSWMGPKIARANFTKLQEKYENRYPVLTKIAEINLSQKTSSLNKFGLKNASLVKAMVEHGCERKPEIAEFDVNGATFIDGSQFECDVVLLATGYRNSFPFLNESFGEIAEDALQPRQKLFKHCFHPDTGTDIAWGGFARPAFGSIPPISELQARWFALLIDGKASLPKAKVMDKVIRQDNMIAMNQFPEDAERIPALTDFLKIMDGIAEQIGCLPKHLLARDPEIWKRVLLCPITGAQYRLRGPGCMPEKAKATLKRTPYLPRTKRYLAYMFLFSILSCIPVFGRRFKLAARWI